MRALYRVLLRAQVNRGRVAGLGLLGLLAVVLGVAVGASELADPVDDGIQLVNAYGLSLFVPVVTLVFASAVLGDPNEDGTLVYLWLRPVARWRIAVAALAATLTIALPIVVVPMVAAAAATGAGPELVRATLASCLVAGVAYAGVFTWLGLRVRRALVWGLAYILVWEGFVARAGATPARLAIRAHSRSLLARMADGDSNLIEVSTTTAVVVPLAVAAVGLLLTARRLARQDVA